MTVTAATWPLDFEAAFQRLLRFEGGFSDHPDDPGGETKFGISKAAFPDVDIKALTMDDAMRLYYDHYWIPSKSGQLHPQHRYIHFDTAVNMGVGRAAHILQYAAQVKQDGIIGPITLNEAWKMNPSKLLRRYAAKRLRDYADLGSFTTFGRGWTRRVSCILEDPFLPGLSER